MSGQERLGKLGSWPSQLGCNEKLHPQAVVMWMLQPGLQAVLFEGGSCTCYPELPPSGTAFLWLCKGREQGWVLLKGNCETVKSYNFLHLLCLRPSFHWNSCLQTCFLFSLEVF